MSIFWNKKIEFDSIIYTRTKKQKSVGISLILIGFILFIGVLTLIKNSFYFSNLSQQYPIPFIILIVFGIILILFTIIVGSEVNFKLVNAKMKNKKVEIKSTNEGDSVIIEN